MSENIGSRGSPPARESGGKCVLAGPLRSTACCACGSRLRPPSSSSWEREGPHGPGRAGPGRAEQPSSPRHVSQVYCTRETRAGLWWEGGRKAPARTWPGSPALVPFPFFPLLASRSSTWSSSPSFLPGSGAQVDESCEKVGRSEPLVTYALVT